MTHKFAETLFTDSVKAVQEDYGSREQNENMLANFGPNDSLRVRESQFISSRDSFYLATVSESGWPYLQHRGGPVGFLKVLSPTLLGFADFGGNAQLVSAGNLVSNDRCAIFMMDYANRRRLKLLGQIRVERASHLGEEELAAVSPANYEASVERVFYIEVHAYDWNCPQHITQRFTAAELVAMKVIEETDEPA